MNRDKSCCFSGHRAAHFDMDASYMGQILQERLAAAIGNAIDDGFAVFYTGMALGFDIVAAEIVLKERAVRAAGEILLVAVVPFAGQEDKWNMRWRKRHNEVLRAADKIVVISPEYEQGCYHVRNRHLVDNSARLICLFGGKRGGTAHTFKYATKKGLEIVNLWPDIQSQDPFMATSKNHH